MTPANELEQFRAKRLLWLESLGGKDQNSIKNQIHRLIWNAATFRVINHARLLAPQGRDGAPELSGLLHEFINNGFSAYQLIGIRRLSDGSPSAGKKSVYSLRRLLTDLKGEMRLFTRWNMMSAEGLNYDYSDVRERYMQYVQERSAAGEKACFVPRELAYTLDENRHKHIDRLTGTDAKARSANDSVRLEVVELLSGRFDRACKEIEVYTNKFVAHAATPESRAAENAEDVSVTLSHIDDAHRIICETVNFVSIYLLGDTHLGFLATPQFDQFKHIDRPLVTRDQIEELRRVWDAFDTETHKWGRWGLDELEAELRTGSDTGPSGHTCHRPTNPKKQTPASAGV